MTHITTVQHTLERLLARFQTSYNEDCLNAELVDGEHCKTALLRGIVPFINNHLKMAGNIPGQAEHSFSSGNFDTSFLILVSCCCCWCYCDDDIVVVTVAVAVVFIIIVIN